MKKFLFTSIFIHSFAILILMLDFKLKEEIKEEQIEVELQMGNEKLQVIENIQENTGDNISEEVRPFYWGIGINTEYYGSEEGHLVTYVYKGYIADISGIQVNDIIFLINNRPISFENDLRGEEHKKLFLTVKRNNSILYFNIERVKVYY